MISQKSKQKLRSFSSNTNSHAPMSTVPLLEALAVGVSGLLLIAVLVSLRVGWIDLSWEPLVWIGGALICLFPVAVHFYLPVLIARSNDELLAALDEAAGQKYGAKLESLTKTPFNFSLAPLSSDLVSADHWNRANQDRISELYSGTGTRLLSRFNGIRVTSASGFEQDGYFLIQGEEAYLFAADGKELVTEREFASS